MCLVLLFVRISGLCGNLNFDFFASLEMNPEPSTSLTSDNELPVGMLSGTPCTAVGSTQDLPAQVTGSQKCVISSAESISTSFINWSPHNKIPGSVPESRPFYVLQFPCSPCVCMGFLFPGPPLSSHRILIFEHFYDFSLNFLSQTIIPWCFILVNWYIHVLWMLKNVCQMKFKKCPCVLCGDQRSAAADVACWSLTGCAVTTDPASAQEPIIPIIRTIWLFFLHSCLVASNVLNPMSLIVIMMKVSIFLCIALGGRHFLHHILHFSIKADESLIFLFFTRIMVSWEKREK